MRSRRLALSFRTAALGSISTIAVCLASGALAQDAAAQPGQAASGTPDATGATTSPTSGQTTSAPTGGTGAAEVNPPASSETTPSSSPTRAPDFRRPGAPSVQEGGVQEIVVTAQKREENLSKVPMSVTAVSANQLAQRQILNTQDLVKVVPGFQFSTSTTGTPVYTIRGIGFNDTSTAARPTVTVYVDQAPLPFSVETIGTTLDLERVEVLKGPQGTLFGQNATGGAINYIAAKPTSTYTAGGTVSYGRFNAHDVEGFVSGPLTDTLEFRVAVKHQGSDGWQRSQTRDDSLGTKDISIGRILLAWHPSDALRVNLNLNGFVDHSDTQAAQFFEYHATTPSQAFKVPAIYRNMAAAPHDDRIADWGEGVDYGHRDKFGQATLRADYDISSKIQLTSLTTFMDFNGRYRQDTDGSAYQFFEVTPTSNLKTFSQELRASASPVDGLRMIVGGNYEHDNTRQIFDERLQSSASFSLSSLPGGPAQFTHVAPRFHIKTDVSAVFANADYDISNKVTLHGGVRYTHARTDFAGCNYDGGEGITAQGFTIIQTGLRARVGLPPDPIQPGGCITFSTTAFAPQVVNSVLSENNVSWRGGIDFKPTSTTLLYANVSRGYKIGSFPELGASFDTQYKPATQESVIAYEAGFKTTLFDRRVRLEGAGFYYDYKDKQVFGSFQDPQFGALKAEVNVPKSRLYGAEAALTWVPSSHLTLSASGTYLNSRITKDYTILNLFNAYVNVKGEGFPFTPKWQGLGDIEYRTPVGNDLTGFVGASARAQTKSVGELGNLPDFRIDGYALLDLRAGVRGPGERWSLSAWMNNVANTYYWNNATTYQDTVVRYTGMPRTFGVTFSIKTG